MENKNKTLIAYLGIIAVIFIWGLSPLLKKALIGDSFSASVYTAVTTFSAACILLLISRKQLKSLTRDYFKIAVPTGLCVGAAGLCQALAYNFDASPTNQAFLENLSCITVPVLLLLIIGKKPNPMTVTASVVCLFSSMVLAGIFDTGLHFSFADVLNAAAGLLFGVNIALTGIYAKKYVASLYVMVQLFVRSVFLVFMVILFNFVKIDGEPIDKIVFTTDVLLILALIGIGVITNAVCWTVRTTAMKHVSATVVSGMMPFSAVITGVFAVIVGQDRPTVHLLLGAVLGLAASFMSAAGDTMDKKKEKSLSDESRVEENDGEQEIQAEI